MAGHIPWEDFEIKYARLFPSDAGNGFGTDANTGTCK